MKGRTLCTSKGWFSTLIGYADKEKPKFLLSIILSITSVVSGFMPYYCIYRVVDLFASNSVTAHAILFWCVLGLIFFFIKALFYGLSTGLSHHVAFHVIEGLRNEISSRFLHAPLGNVQKYSIGEIKNIMIDKIEKIEPPLAHIVPEGAGHIALPIVSVIALACIDWRIALAAFVTLPVALVCMTLTFKISGENFTRYNESNAYMSSVIVEYIEGIEVIKAFGREGVSYEKYSHAITDYRTFVIKWMSSTWITMKLAFAFFPATLLGTLPVSLFLATHDIITASQVALAVMLSMSMVSSLARLEVFSESIRQMQETVIELEQYLSMHELPETKQHVNITHYDVSLKNVRFAYDELPEHDVLHNISINLPQGSFTALVGPSGSGKSTVAKLIARFWDVREGSILIGSHDIKTIPLEQLTNMVSFVAQDNFLFRCSILENIRMGNPNASDEEVKHAAQLAQCEEFILKLPLGYDTPAGDAGKRLSGGEKQRIAIARMILKDAPIVILDEATAFTDPENEDKIQQSINALTQGKTLLVIAHRLSTIRNADAIVVLDRGNIVDQGTQEELLARCDLYKKMWEAHIGTRLWALSSTGSTSYDNQISPELEG